MNDVWTSEQEELLLRLRAEGLPMPAIAPRVGHPVPACYTRLYRLTDRRTQPKAPLGEDRRDLLVDLFERGFSASDIAVRVDRDVHVVQYALTALGLVRGRRRAWIVQEDVDVRRAFEGRGEDDALDVACRATGRLRSEIVARRRVQVRRDRTTASPASTVRARDWFDRIDPALVLAVREAIEDGTQAKELARRHRVSSDVVRRVAKRIGVAFAKGWSAAELATLDRLAASASTQVELARTAADLMPARDEAAILAKIRSLRLRVGGPKPERLVRAVVPARTLAPVRAASTPIVAPIGVGRGMPAASVRRKVAAAPPAAGDLAAMMERFRAGGGTVTKVGADVADPVVTGLRRRGFTVVGEGDGYRVDGRRVFADRAELERFATAHRVAT